MQTQLLERFRATADGQAADEILRACVHCGFCTATCPTYQLLGDELDGPRGRIYQIKQVLEGAPVTRTIQQHLDRCLTCRSCETTCPSGVRYAELLDIGRAVVAKAVPRPWHERLLRAALAWGLTQRWLMAPAVRLGQWLRPLLPAALARKVPARQMVPEVPTVTAPRHRYWLLEGCVQPVLAPQIDAAARRVLAAVGVALEYAPGSTCCGALEHHLDRHDAAKARARGNIEAWLPAIERGEVAGVVITASGCGAHVRAYPTLFRDEPQWRERAERLAAKTYDLSEVIVAHEQEVLAQLPVVAPGAHGVVAFHAPCTLQHALKVRGVVERLLAAAGWVVPPVREAHLCCGSAGTYSILQREISTALRARKLEALAETGGALIATANIGCLLHLAEGASVPVRHWIELIAEAMDGRGTG